MVKFAKRRASLELKLCERGATKKLARVALPEVLKIFTPPALCSLIVLAYNRARKPWS